MTSKLLNSRHQKTIRVVTMNMSCAFTPLAFKSKKLLVCSAIAAVLSSCGGSGQDDGEPSGFSQQFSGVIVDGHLARATVFIDSNNNGTRDAWEAFAFTDNDGYYSFNLKTNTDYCVSTASPQEQQYCLVSKIAYDNVIIRIDGGYDVLTEEPFLGQMSRRVNAEMQGNVTDSVISPITSLLSNAQNVTDRTSLLNSLGIEENDLDVDYLNTDGAGNINSHLLNTALKIHKVAAVLSDRLTDTYSEIGEDFGTPNDASSSVYASLAEQIINNGNALDVAIEDENVLLATLDVAETALRQVYERKDFSLPTDMGNISSPGEFARIVDIAARIPSIVNILINAEDSALTIEEATGATRALESLIIKTIAERSTSDTTIDNAMSFFLNRENSVLITALIQAISDDIADIGALVQNDFTGDDFDSADEIQAVSRLPDSVEPFSQIGGMQLRTSDLDLGRAPNKLKDSEVELYFNGNVNNVDGSFSACIKLIDGANIDGTLGEGNTRGELVDGFWSLLGASQDDPESYSLLLTLTFLGTTYQAIMKPAEAQTVSDISYDRIRFDNDGELSFWHSREGWTPTESIPTTNSECEARLPSRVDI
ncbi:MAG: hypothetical protein ACI93R_002519 [Flavobacteriales bacterium]|jgi:hypothetical protein